MSEENKSNEEVKQNEQVEVASAEASQSASSEASSASVTETETSTAEKSQSETKKERFVPLSELQKERQRRRELEAELRAEIEKVKSTVSTVTRQDPIKELMDDFGVDESTAKKMHEKYGLGKTQKSEQVVDEIGLLKEKFQKRAIDVSSDYEDWNDLQADMASVLQREYEISPKSALMKSPEEYYHQAKLLRSQKEKEASVKEVINKSNSKNLASTESAKNDSGKPGAVLRKGTRAWLKSLSHEEFVKNHDYINAELARGGFKE